MTQPKQKPSPKRRGTKVVFDLYRGPKGEYRELFAVDADEMLRSGCATHEECAVTVMKHPKTGNEIRCSPRQVPAYRQKGYEERDAPKANAAGKFEVVHVDQPHPLIGLKQYQDDTTQEIARWIVEYGYREDWFLAALDRVQKGAGQLKDVPANKRKEVLEAMQIVEKEARAAGDVIEQPPQG